MSYLTLTEICEELALVDDQMTKLEAAMPPAADQQARSDWEIKYHPLRQRMYRLVRMLGDSRRSHVGAARVHYRPIVDQVLAGARR